MKKLEKTKNAKRNLIAGVINKLVVLLLPFMLRTLMIYLLGIEYVGINSLFASILSVLSLAELGFGSALVHSMYKPIAENDTKTICALMKFYRKCYRIIGTIIFVVGIVMLPFIKFIVNKDVPNDINIYIVYLISLFSTGITYFLFGYKNSLLSAHQRADVTSNIGTVMILVRYALEIGLLVLFHNYYIYMVIAPIVNMSNNIITAYIVNKMWPEYRPSGELNPEIKNEIAKKVRGLIVYKIGHVVINSADTIVISTFLGLKVLGQYQNYYFIITSLFGFYAILYSAVTAGIGNAMVTETKEKVYKMFEGLLLLQGMITTWCIVCLFNLYQPFIALWAGKDNLLPDAIAVLLCVSFFQWKIQDTVYFFKEAGGMWDRDKFRPLVAACTNLTLNIILVNYIGLYGVIISTIFAGIVVDMPWACRILYHDYFEKGSLGYFKKVGLYFVATIVVCAVVTPICTLISSATWLGFFIKAFVTGGVGVIVVLMLYSRFSGFDFVLEKAKRVLKIK